MNILNAEQLRWTRYFATEEDMTIAQRRKAAIAAAREVADGGRLTAEQRTAVINLVNEVTGNTSTPRGGKRAGAGRPRRNAEALDTAVTVRITASEAAALRAFAAERGVSVSEAASRALAYYLACVGA